MNRSETSANRIGPWYTLLPAEQELATPVLHGLWFQLFDSSHIEVAIEGKPKILRSITTPGLSHLNRPIPPARSETRLGGDEYSGMQHADGCFCAKNSDQNLDAIALITTLDAYRRALHDYFAFVCLGRPADPAERAVAQYFVEDNLVSVAPDWAIDSDDEDVLRTGIYNYMPENPVDDSWMTDVPEEEREWFQVCDLIELLTEYDDLSVAQAALKTMLLEGMTRPEADLRLRTVVAPLARISKRDMEILGVGGCQTPLEVPDDWSEEDGISEDRVVDDLHELACRVHDGQGQPVLETTAVEIHGRSAAMEIVATSSTGSAVRSFVGVFRLGDDSCEIRLASDGRSCFHRTPSATWGRLARVDELAEAWADLLGVKPSPVLPQSE